MSVVYIEILKRDSKGRRQKLRNHGSYIGAHQATIQQMEDLYDDVNEQETIKDRLPGVAVLRHSESDGSFSSLAGPSVSITSAV